MVKIDFISTILFVNFVYQIAATVSDICYAQECVYKANIILQSMSPRLDPCDDFYQFACGAFLVENDGEYVGHLAVTERKLYKDVRLALDGVNRLDKEIPLPFRQLGVYKDLCLQREINSDKEQLALMKLLQLIGGEYLISENKSITFQEDSFSLEKRAKQLQGFDNDFLMVVEFPLMEYTRQRRDMKLTLLPTLSLDVLVELSSGNRFNLNSTERENVLKLMKLQLNSLRMSRLVTTIGELKEKYSIIDWTEYLKQRTLNLFPITDNVELIVVPDYLDALFKIYAENRKTVSDYQLVQLWFLSTSQGHILTADYDPKDLCFGAIFKDFKIGLFALLVDRNDNKLARQTTEEFIRQMKKQIRYEIENSDWLDKNNTEKAVLKLEGIRGVIGFPPQLKDLKFVTSFYKDLKTESTFFEMQRNLRTINLKARIREYLNPPKDILNLIRIIEIDLLSVNSYFIFNNIYIARTTMEPPFFHLNTPSFVNYAGLGGVVAHELFHAFDAVNIGRNEEGFVEHWLSKRSQKVFAEKVKCFVDQYNSFVDPSTGIKVNGLMTLSDNMADVNRARIPYHAFKEADSLAGIKTQSLPGLNYTIDQQFWLTYASNMCESVPQKLAHFLMENADHAMSRFRVNGPLQNSPEFARDFQCPVGSRMNPKVRCGLFH